MSSDRQDLITLFPGFALEPLRVRKTTFHRAIAITISTSATLVLALFCLYYTSAGRKLLGMQTQSDLIAESRAQFQRVFHALDAAERNLLREAGLSPDTAVYAVTGNTAVAWSADVVAAHSERGYRLRPNCAAVWYDGTIPLGMPVSFLLPDSDRIRILAAEAGWRPHPDSEEYYNSHGFRSAEYNYDADVTVLFIGDSFAHGMRIPQKDTFASVCEKILADRINSKTVQVVNTGVVGYGLSEEFATLRQCVERFDYDPDVVVQHICVNDISPDQFKVLSSGEADWDQVCDTLHEVRRYCRNRNAVFVVSLIPDRSQLYGNTVAVANYQGKLISKLGFAPQRIFDPLQALMFERLQVRHASGREDTSNPLFLNRDKHFSEFGSRCYASFCAEGLLTILLRKGVIDSSELTSEPDLPPGLSG